MIAVESLDVVASTVPTDEPESDGTLEWDATTIVIVEAEGGGQHGLGYSYCDEAAATLIRDRLAPVVAGVHALDVPAAWGRMVQAVRNVGRPGLASCAIAAVDVALWDLKARLLGVSLASLLGVVRETVPVYASGGFTSYSVERLQEQLGGWADAGLTQVKMKVGRDFRADPARVAAAREAIGESCELYVDANGAYTRKQALAFAERFSEVAVTWFEEPVSSDDLEGLRLLRDRAPAGIAIAAGEYGYDLPYFRRMAQAGAVDVLQADATRCGGITGLLQAADVAEAFGLPLSTHTAPSIHAQVGCALRGLAHAEYFHDHVRVERMLFDGVLEPAQGALRPDRSRPGLGLELKRGELERRAA